MEIRNTELEVIIPYEEIIKFIEKEKDKSLEDYEITEVEDTGDEIQVRFGSK